MAVSNVELRVDARNAINALQQVNRASGETEQALNGINSAASKLRTVFAGIGIIGLVKATTQAAASFNDLQTRLKLLSSQYGEYNKAQEFALKSAAKFGQSNREALAGFTDIYARLKPLGVSLKDIGTTYSGFNTVAKLSGVSAEGASAAFTQLAQALGSGRLQGDEFRSIGEQIPGLLAAVSLETGIATKDLKKFASDGKLTSDIIINALRRIETEGSGKIAALVQASDVQKFKNLQNAVDALSIAVGNQLLPILTPLIVDVTNLINAIAALPEPVKAGITQLVKFTVEAILVQKAIQGIIALRAGFIAATTASTAAIAASGAAAATSSSAFALYTANTRTLTAASAAAVPPITALQRVLSSLAAIGTITIVVNAVTKGFGELFAAYAEIEKLRGRKIAGGAAATFKGSTKEEVLKQQQIAKQVIKNEQKTRQQLTSVGGRALQVLNIGGVLNAFGANVPTSSSAAERINVGKARISTAQDVLGLDPNKFPGASKLPATVTGGGLGATGTGGATKTKAAKKDADQSAKQIADAQSILRLSQSQFDIEGRILEARAQNNDTLVITRTAQKELAGIANEIANVQANKELPDAAKKAQIADLELKAKGVSRQLAFDIANAEKDKAKNAAEGLQKLQDEQALLQARLAGNEAEVILAQQIRDIKAQYPGLNEADIKSTLEKINVLKQQISAAEQLKQLYTDIGTSIKSGVVDAIQGAIDGTKSLQEVASSLLKNIANTLLNVAVNLALFGAISGTGTGGGLLGSFFKPRAKGGSVMGGQPYLVGERGPELFMPGRSGGIAPTGSFGGGANIVVNVDASGSSVQGNDQDSKQLGRAIAAAVQSELIKQKRPGGLLA